MEYYALQEHGEPEPSGLARFDNGIAYGYAGHGKWIESAPLAGWVISRDGVKGPIDYDLVEKLRKLVDDRTKPS